MTAILMSGMWLQVIVNPPGKHRGFHRCRPRLRQCPHPSIEIKACGGKRTFCVDAATRVFHAVANRPLVNIQSDVIHSLHGGASFGVSESARSLSSAFVRQALPLDLYIQTIRPLGLGFAFAITNRKHES